jgi:hypothetical protein
MSQKSSFGADGVTHRDSINDATMLHAWSDSALRRAAAPAPSPPQQTRRRASLADQLPGLRWLRSRYYRFVSSLLGSDRGRS